jgi:hypothetical protein
MTPGHPAVLRRIEAFIDRVGQVTLYLTLAMIALVATNVLLRYAFSVGSVWAQELEWHLLAAVILLGMSYALQRGDNVRVDLFYAGFTPAHEVHRQRRIGRADAAGGAAVHQAVAGLRDAVLQHRRDLGRPGWHRLALGGEGPDPAGLRPAGAADDGGDLMRLVVEERLRQAALRA